MLAVVAMCAVGCQPGETGPVEAVPAATVRASTMPSTLAPRFETYDVADGLPANEVSAVMQDRRGFLWVGTFGGLARFDGAAFKVFLHAPSDSLSLGNNTVNALLEDRDGRIWVGTEGGLDRFDPETETFAHVFANEQTRGAVRTVVEDAAGNVWVGTYGNGVARYAPATGAATGAVTWFRHPPGASGRRTTADVATSLAVGPEGVAWVGTLGGLYRLDVAAGTFTRVAAEQIRAGVFSLHLDRGGDLWVGTYDDGLFRIHPQPGAMTGAARHYGVGASRPGALGHSWVLSLLVDRAGTVWAGTDGGGLHRYDPVADAFVRYVHDPSDEGSLRSDRVLSLYEDRTGVLWAGGYGGLQRRYPLSRVAERAANRPGDPASLSAGGVTAFAEDAAGALWVGTDGGGLNRALGAGRFAHERHDPSDGASLAGDNIAGIAAAPDGTLWVGTYSGLDRRAPGGRYARVAAVDPGGVALNLKASKPYGGAGEGGVWVSGDAGLFHIDAGTGAVHSYGLDVEGRSALVTAMLLGRDGRFWSGTYDAGLCRLDRPPRTGTSAEAAVFTCVRHDAKTPKTLSSDAVTSLSEDRDGALWVGTGDGLDRFDPATGTARRFHRADGLPSAVIADVLVDGAGTLWVSTAVGLTRFDARTETFQTYGPNDGLGGLGGALYLGPRTGTVYAAGLGGYVAFDPSRFPGETPPPAPVLTGLRLLGQPVPVGADGSTLARPLALTDRLRLRYDDRVVTLGFAALDFTAPASQRYAVRLDGFDTDWRDVGGRREATFTNLGAGRYTFRVRAAGRDGVWGPETRLAIDVAPPWWRSVWAYALYLLAAFGIGMAATQHREGQRRLAREAERERLAAAALRALDRSKSAFFANVSHEFRTPLTLTLGPLDDVLAGEYGPVPAEAAGALALARRSGGRVLDLIGQILDLSRLEAGSTPLRARRLDLGAFARAQVDAFALLASHRRIAVDVVVAATPVDVWADPEHIGTILANVLSNAFKFTPEGGRVRVDVEADRDTARVTVRDTGPGIAPADLAHVFDRFFQVAGSAGRPLGSGIGLALAHDLAALHHGALTATSRTDDGEAGESDRALGAFLGAAASGSAFTLELPLGRAHLTPDQIDERPWDGPDAQFPRPDDATNRLAGETPLPSTTHDTPAQNGADDDRDDVTTVLVADDNDDIRAYVRRHLEAAGYRVVEAGDGEEALACARARLPDLVVSDVMMPRLDGLGLCRALRADPETDFVPILLLTAKASPENVLEGLAEACDAYLTKPFDVRELVARVDNLIGLRRRLRERFSAPTNTAGDGAPGGPDASEDAHTMSVDEAFAAAVRAAIVDGMADEAFDVGALAAALGQSRSQLLRRTTALLGASPSDLIRVARLDHAARLLRARAGTVSEIAYAVGFKSVAHFSNAFLAHTGARPSAYADAAR